MRTFIALAALCALSAAACTKETTVPNNATKLRGKWKISASKRTSLFFLTQRDSTVNFFPQLKACYKDDLLTLQEGFNGNVFYGAVSCTVMEQQTDAITWQLLQGDTLEVNNAKQFFSGADSLRGSNPMRGQLLGDIGSTFTIRYRNNELDSFNRPEVVTYENTYTRQ